MYVNINVKYPQVSHKSLEERALRFTVFDVDRYRKHHVIGHAVYPLKEHDCTTSDKVVIWRDLERDISQVYDDNITIS